MKRLVSRSVFLTKPCNPEEVCTLLMRLTGAAHRTTVSASGGGSSVPPARHNS